MGASASYVGGSYGPFTQECFFPCIPSNHSFSSTSSPIASQRPTTLARQQLELASRRSQEAANATLALTLAQEDGKNKCDRFMSTDACLEQENRSASFVPSQEVVPKVTANPSFEIFEAHVVGTIRCDMNDVEDDNNTVTMPLPGTCIGEENGEIDQSSPSGADTPTVPRAVVATPPSPGDRSKRWVASSNDSVTSHRRRAKTYSFNSFAVAAKQCTSPDEANDLCFSCEGVSEDGGGSKQGIYEPSTVKNGGDENNCTGEYEWVDHRQKARQQQAHQSSSPVEQEQSLERAATTTPSDDSGPLVCHNIRGDITASPTSIHENPPSPPLNTSNSATAAGAALLTCETRKDRGSVLEEKGLYDTDEVMTRLSPKEQLWRKIFMRFDLNKSGTISLLEMQEGAKCDPDVLMKLGLPSSVRTGKTSLADVLYRSTSGGPPSSFDEKKDEISWEEFRGYLAQRDARRKMLLSGELSAI